MESSEDDLPPRLPFPPLTRSHILHCSYYFWYPLFRSITPKARLIPLTAPFLSYLRADGIILPPDPNAHDSNRSSPAFSTDPTSQNTTSSTSSTSDSDSDTDSQPPSFPSPETSDPSTEWPDVHQNIISAITELGGSVMPKLNWSSPKDATWMNANTMACTSPQEIYLLLKSSDFVTFDLEHAFDGCLPPDLPQEEEQAEQQKQKQKHEEETTIPWTLILRKTIPAWKPSLEFRCFVHHFHLLCISQRDMNHYPFLASLAPKLTLLIKTFIEEKIVPKFPEEDFVADVYVSGTRMGEENCRVWLVDINPFAERTDPLLFSWGEILRMGDSDYDGTAVGSNPRTMRVNGHDDRPFNPSLNGAQQRTNGYDHTITSNGNPLTPTPTAHIQSQDEHDSDAVVIMQQQPEIRLLNATAQPQINTSQYSAHKLPKDVVDASTNYNQSSNNIMDFMARWRDIVSEQESARSKRRDG